MYIFSPPFICFFVLFLFELNLFLMYLFFLKLRWQKMKKVYLCYLHCVVFLFTLKKVLWRYNSTGIRQEKMVLQGTSMNAMTHVPWYCHRTTPKITWEHHDNFSKC